MTKHNSIIIMASSRVDGHTHQIAEVIQAVCPSDRIDLALLLVGPYTYDHKHKADDFIPLIQTLADHELVILLTPVYWYSMSGLMKTFLDRLTDCLQIEKDLGRQLRGKRMICISCGSEEEEIEGYFVPFERSAEYLGMSYLGNLHTWITGDDISDRVRDKILEIFEYICPTLP